MKELENPREFQDVAINTAIRHLLSGASCLIESPTGSGKTLIFSTLIKRLNPRGRTLILASRDMLCRQPFKYRWLAERGGRDNWGSQIVATTPQSAVAYMDHMLRYGKIDLVVVDECHGSVAPTMAAAVARIKAQGGRVVGVTATPDRADAQWLDTVFDVSVVAITIEECIKRGYVATPILHSYRMPDGAGILGRHDEIAIVAKQWWQEARKRQSILFTPTIKRADEYAAYLNRYGVCAAAISGRMNEDQRDEIIRRYEAGEVRVLCNAEILTEGVDLPMTRCVVMAKSPQSRKVFAQAVGRGMRIGPNGEKDTLVLDFGYRENHTLVPDHNGFGEKESGLAELLERCRQYDGMTPAQAMAFDAAAREAKRQKNAQLLELARGRSGR